MSKKTGPGIYNFTIEHCDESGVKERTLAQGGGCWGAMVANTDNSFVNVYNCPRAANS